MSQATADAALRGIFDRYAKLRQAAKSAWTGGTDFWARVDAAADETFENIVKGQIVTDLDTTIENAAIGDQAEFGAVLALISTYFSNATTGQAPGLGYSSDPLNSYLDARRFRVAYEFAQLWADKYSSAIDPQFIFPKGTWAADIGDNSTAGLHAWGEHTRGASTWTFAAGDGLLPATVQGAAVMLVSDVGVTGNITSGTVTVVLQDRLTPKTVSLPSPQTFAADAQVKLGQEAITSGAAAAQADVAVAATAQFTEGDWVIIVEDAVTEVAQVKTVTTNTKLTMEDNLVNSFTTSGVVIPLFTNVTAMAATGGSSGEKIQLYALPDRAIAL